MCDGHTDGRTENFVITKCSAIAEHNYSTSTRTIVITTSKGVITTSTIANTKATYDIPMVDADGPVKLIFHRRLQPVIGNGEGGVDVHQL